MEVSGSAHPSDQTLRAYGIGKLYGALADSVHSHLDVCTDCRQRVAELSDDTFLGRLRGARVPGESAMPVGPSPAGMSSTEGTIGSVAPLPASSVPSGLAEHPDYEILGELGRGGMGVVYLAQNKLMGRNEVLKVVSRDLMSRRGVLNRFLREIRNAAQLHHTNIVTAYSAIRAGENMVFAMEYVEGYDLSQLVKGRGPLPVALACNFIHQAALGLQYAHEKGMVHRDIKPSNLILARDGNKPVVKVLDFGLAKVTRERPVDGSLTHEGQMLGTPDYIAPEQSLNATKADIRADIYSLGCTLYYLLSGGPPFTGSSLYEILQAHHSMEARPLNLVRPEVPWELAAVVGKMMAKEPARRYQTPGDVAQALKPFFKPAEAVLVAPKPHMSHGSRPSAGRPQPTPRSNPRKPATSAGSSATPPPSASISLEATQSHPDRQDLLAIAGEIPSVAPPGPVAVASSVAYSPWFWPAVGAGSLLLGLLIFWAAGVLKVKTEDGVIVLENIPESAVVEVDGERVTVMPGRGELVKIERPPGKHGVVVKRGEVVVMGESVSLEAGKEIKLAVRLERSVPPRSAPAPDAEVVSRPLPGSGSAAGTGTRSGSASVIDRTRFAVRSGRWHVEADELVQKDLTPWYSAIMFGDEQWTDCDFSVDAMQIGEGKSFSLFFRATDRAGAYKLVISGGVGTCYVAADERSSTRILKSANLDLPERRWHTARVHIRGNRFACFLYDAETGKDTRLFDINDDRFPAGRVGLETFTSSFRFKNIRVTSPDGKVLWEGPPAVGATSLSAETRSVPPKLVQNSVASRATSFLGAEPPIPSATHDPSALEIDRGRPLLVALYCAIPPVADGALQVGEYGNARFVDFTFTGNSRFGALETFISPIRSKRPDDLSVRLRAGYSDKSLFLAFQVRDQFVDAQPDDRARPQCNDGVEIFLDGDRVSNDFFFPAPPKGKAVGASSEGFQLIADSAGHQFTMSSDFTNNEWKSAAKRYKEGYVIEVEIPLSLIDIKDGPQKVAAGPGSTINFGLAINDNDAAVHRQMSYAYIRARPSVSSPCIGREDSWSFGIKLRP
jgi:serine/threonine protein kinase